MPNGRLNTEMYTGFVLVTVNTPYAYLHSLQNVSQTDYALVPWVLEVLCVIRFKKVINFIHFGIYFHYYLHFLTITEKSACLQTALVGYM